MKKLSLAGIIFGAVVIVSLLVPAIFANDLTSYDPIRPSIDNRLAPPSQQHPFGTDGMGRDVQARVFHGLRTSLGIGLLAVVMSLVSGGVLGMLAGLFGGMVHNIIISYTRFLAAGPGIILAIVVVWVGGTGTFISASGISLLLAPGFTRVFSIVVSCLRDGNVDRRGYTKKAFAAIIARISSSIGIAALIYAGFGLIGLGAQPPAPELGAMIGQGFEFLRNASFLVVYPSLALTLFALSFGIFGESLNAFIVEAKGGKEGAIPGGYRLGENE